jgi:hypothetical protein
VILAKVLPCHPSHAYPIDMITIVSSPSTGHDFLTLTPSNHHGGLWNPVLTALDGYALRLPNGCVILPWFRSVFFGGLPVWDEVHSRHVNDFMAMWDRLFRSFVLCSVEALRER